MVVPERSLYIVVSKFMYIVSNQTCEFLAVLKTLVASAWSHALYKPRVFVCYSIIYMNPDLHLPLYRTSSGWYRNHCERH